MRSGRAKRPSHKGVSVDLSPEAVEARMDALIKRTRGWATNAVKAVSPNDPDIQEPIQVLCGPTRANPPLKRDQ